MSEGALQQEQELMTCMHTHTHRETYTHINPHTKTYNNMFIHAK